MRIDVLPDGIDKQCPTCSSKGHNARHLNIKRRLKYVNSHFQTNSEAGPMYFELLIPMRIIIEYK